MMFPALEFGWRRVLRSAAGLGILTVLIGLVACSKPADPPNLRHPLAVETKRHSLEVPLAKKGEFYVVFDFLHRLVQFKIRGVALRELKIADLKVHRSWPAPAVREALIRKALAREPDRTVIDPPKGTGEDSDTETVVVEKLDDSFEIEDMPSMYTLEFEDGSRILVLSRSPHPLGFLQRLSGAAIRFLFFVQRLMSPNSAAATVVLQPEEARALYWSFTVNHQALIVAPA